ncbi:TIGR04282 family arsenosugar biosynthesis glycosyltransferase [Lunatibacter salilacus]|uniref:TIGR04282 family arsenosugar biosynthesis glycosyltransferase n=1 Tax=Lunatibacter salilacus TaxID=2483804 RepID=UPI00131E111F|nr:TIGR04282 family arsenosugar biosynthesis glycosyltransferase [Lunatibacter salilacus]
MKKAIIVFQKAAVSGNVKTRLAQRIGDAQALKVYSFLVAYTHRQLEDMDADIFVFFAGEPDSVYSENSNYHICRQCGGDLGARMAAAFAEVFDAGYEQVLIIGTDCHELKSNILQDAFQGLNATDMVIGPAKDGGYYLLGLTSPIPELFEGIQWSTASVFTDTMEIASSLVNSVYLLPILSDVDRYEDLGELSALLGLKEINM